MLILPAIMLAHETCFYSVVGEPGTEGKYPLDPMSIAKMWRKENAKALHVTDLDGALAGKPVHAEFMAEMVRAVDIAIQISGGFRTYEAVREAITVIGAYRVVVSTLAMENYLILKELVDEFGPRKIVAGIDVLDGKVLTHGRATAHEIGPLELAKRLEEAGMERIVFTDLSLPTESGWIASETLQSLLMQTRLSVTVNGGVDDYAQLAWLQNLSPRRIDSVILDESLYQNHFPCQSIWRNAEKILLERGSIL